MYCGVVPTKKKQRAKGEGSPVWLKEKQVWRYSVQINGQKIERTARTQSEAREKVLRIARGRVSGSFGELTPSSKIRELIQVYLDTRESDSKASTHSGRESVLRLYVLPHIGNIPLEKLSSGHVSAMLKDLQKSGGQNGTGVSEQTAKHALKQTRAILHFAQIRDLVRNNVASGDFVKSPRVEKNTRAMTREEWDDLQKAIVDEPLRALIHLAVNSGLRRGELLGLTWDDLDLKSKNPTLRVVRTISRETGKGLVIGSPKTKASRRTIHLHEKVVAELQVHRERQSEIKSAIVADGMEWSAMFPKMRWVFTNGIGNPVEGDYFGKQLHRMTNEAGLDPYTVHELRHTCASFAIASAVGLKELSEMLGHSDIGETSDTYGHLYPASSVESARKIGSYAYD